MFALAEAADRAGFHSLWKGEASWDNAPMILAQLAETTETVKLGTGVANVFSRSPALLAMSAATLNQLSEGRAILGLGVSSPSLVEQWHGTDFKRPLRRLREVIEIIRMLFTEETVDYDGQIFDIGPFSVSEFVTGTEVPIYNAAIGETNQRLTGEFTDGWNPVLIPLESVDSAISRIKKSATDSRRDPDAITYSPVVPAAVSDDRDRAESLTRSHLAREMAMGYDRVLEQYGYGDQAKRAGSLWRDGDRKAAGRVFEISTLEQFAVFGPPGEVRAQMEPYFEAGADVLTMWPTIDATPTEIEYLIQTCAP
jgi:alkanesulfonate monooxygenase SsuD/methylene tetrahydromethanopterin reductase-like flavin-dependent oxidoreductase (luciferase family)